MRDLGFFTRRLRRAGAIAAAATCLLLAGCTDHPQSVDNRTLFNPYYSSGGAPQNRNAWRQ